MLYLYLGERTPRVWDMSDFESKGALKQITTEEEVKGSSSNTNEARTEVSVPFEKPSLLIPIEKFTILNCIQSVTLKPRNLGSPPRRGPNGAR
eukprot:8023648-Pyramimonas_sp.AAC.1